ncbi:E set domain-containing protein [Coccomyxa subellipsoidea C-169]|uniref:E set domain-containing protein n=1 Tax=Coccomyxa subellipsoidea (strain C-169) TaxID=574566 RepID=I0Z6D5_COCSC|nr:E set domain-containing protein [Coccomyxa subellipsoidea C-169]EIE26204.1 E set domain-containing protein [Coccomyxa subellipsoidea C-169]|eukprot:XP_005650748.1 E set domain-containing protein [Coccomyxa subellipsoidea C-169]
MAQQRQDDAEQLTVNVPNLLDRPVPAKPNPMARFVESSDSGTSSALTPGSSLMRHPDRGTGFYFQKRERYGRASLVETGRHAGRSRVTYYGFSGHTLGYHAWKRDFFTSGINLRLPVAIGLMVALYMLSYFFWGIIWLFVYWHDKSCVAGFEKRYHGIVSAFMFATETQQTIGYGARRPRDCWISAWLVAMEVIWGQLLDAITLGIIFARIAHPKNRARTVFISDCAAIARRDGALKFMFRVADVVSPRVRAFLYTWGGGRTTAEGEHIPFRADPLRLLYEDHLSLVLPLTLEHEIDERSPLYGHTYDSLTALDAEVVVLFEGVTETGALFGGKRSYLPTEIHWGYVFAEITHQSKSASTRHAVDLSRFHEVEPQKDLEQMLPQQIISQHLLKKNHRVIPFPALSEKTLVLSEVAVVGTKDTPDGQLSLMVRIGDVYPDNMVQLAVRMYLYRWNDRLQEDATTTAPYEVHQLEVTPARLLLRLPMTVRHIITESSPLSNWRSGQAGIAADASSEIIVVVDSVKYDTSKVIMAKRIYVVHSHIKYGYRFEPMVSRVGGRAPRITWSSFHDVAPAPPNLPRVRSSRSLQHDASRGESLLRAQSERPPSTAQALPRRASGGPFEGLFPAT